MRRTFFPLMKKQGPEQNFLVNPTYLNYDFKIPFSCHGFQLILFLLGRPVRPGS